MNEATQNPPPPFSYQFSPNVPELLKGLGCSVAISTYQTGKVIIFSAKDEDRLVQLPRNFQRPMGMDVKNDRWAIALQNEIIITANAPGLASNYPQNPNTYDALYVPRASFYTGPLDLHDLAFGDEDRLYAVNTSFSCLSEVSSQHSFRPIWKPDFISALMPEDRCHLNGLTLEGGEPRFVTALGQGDSARSWKEKMLTDGILMDVPSNEIIAAELPTPHSPRLYEDGLYMLLSATGELVKMDVKSGKYDVITRLNGFLRGMDRVGDYLFIATSRLRKGSSIFREAPVAQKSVVCGIMIVYIPTGQQAGYIVYNTSVEELFEVKLLKGSLRPNILNEEKGLHKTTISTVDNVFWLGSEKKDSDAN